MNQGFRTQLQLVSDLGVMAYSDKMDAGNEVLVYDQPEPCPYLPGKTARLPLRMPDQRLSGGQFDARLAAGDRRAGMFLYTTACEQCRACESIRLDVNDFTPSRAQQRAWKRGQQEFRLKIGSPRVDADHVSLFNKHRTERNLAKDRQPLDEEAYAEFLAISCCQTVELAYYRQEVLAMVAIVDVGAIALSAVYTYYDPDVSKLSPGVYSIMQEIDLCRRWQRQYLYLGLYIAESVHMKYKGEYRPHERRIEGQWRRFA